MPEDQRDETVDFPNSWSSIVSSTGNALYCYIRVSKYEVRQIWVPNAIIHDDSEVFEPHTEGTLVLYRWWAEKQKLL